MENTIKIDKNLSVIDISNYDKDVILKSKELSNELSVKDPNSIVNYGMDVQTKLSQFSSSMLENVRNVDTGSIGETIQNLMKDLNYVDVDPIENPFIRFLSNLPIIKNLISTTKNVLNKYDEISNNLNNIILKLDKGKIYLIKDINSLNSMFDNNVDYIKEIDTYIVGAKIKLEELQNELEYLKNNNSDPYEIQDMQNYINRLNKKILDLSLTKQVTIQSLPQIRIIQENNMTLVEKIQSSITNTIPLWKNQICLSVMIDKQRRIVKVQKNVNKTTNELLTKNSDILKSNSLDVAKLNEESIVDIDVIKKVNQDLISTLDEILRIKKEGDQKRVLIQKELGQINNDIINMITDSKKLIQTN
jgi:uncharacterized protein YaaN involved in tellurite resistance